MTYRLRSNYFAPGAGVAGGVFAGLSAGAGAGAGAGFSEGVTVVGGGVFVAGGVVFLSLSGAGVTLFLVSDAGGSFLQPLNVNAANARTANAVRTTFLMIIPFRKILPLFSRPICKRVKTVDSPLNYHRRFTNATCPRPMITAWPKKNQDKIP